MKKMLIAIGLLFAPLGATMDVQGYVNAAHALVAERQYSSALELFFEGLALNPDIIDAQFGKELGEWSPQDIAAVGGCPLPLDKVLQRGDDIAGKTIFVYYKKGHGDTLMFSRFLTPLVEKLKPAKVLFMPQKALKVLFEDSISLLGDNIEVIDADVDMDTLCYDCHTHLLSLPYLLNTSAADIPHQDPYLVAAVPLIHYTGPKRIGIIWQGDPSHIHDKDRSVALKVFETLTEVPGIQLYSLQVGYGREQLDGVNNIIDLGQHCRTFADVASWMATMDSVVTIDSAGAHLASGLGVPTMVLVPKHPDLRWAGEGDRGFWSDTTILMRQDMEGDWTEVMERIKAMLMVR